MQQRLYPYLLVIIALFVVGALVTLAQDGEPQYLPVIVAPEAPPGQMVEFRGLWVTRFDWTQSGQPADPARIDEIVDNAAAAGFNAVLFQVRGAADAYYTPGLEPWARQVSGGALGEPPSPLWDPLAYFIEKAHSRDIQLHAYLNVHPVTDNCNVPPPETTPRPFYYLLRDEHGITDGKLNGMQWTTAGEPHCSVYLRFSPASQFADEHLLAVVADLVARYDIDGLHLDNVRYGDTTTSCDPVSEAAYGAPCFTYNGHLEYEEWQRQQVTGTVRKLYEQVVVPGGRDLWLSAAVWPIYRDYWGWGGIEGYSDYYQDSKAWVNDGAIDSILPMIYPSTFDCPDNSFWTKERWQALAADFQASRGDRYVIPGIGTGYCTFGEINDRIEMARSIGTAGHALFSYGGLKANDYFDELAAGPYALPAVVPDIPWRGLGTSERLEIRE
jgi:uncharacterized lipoprotein YddW (UPF0748 family)